MTDFSKYGTPVSDDKGFVSKTDLSKYGQVLSNKQKIEQAKTEATALQNKADLMGSKSSLAKATLKGLPKEAFKTIVGNVPKFLTSAAASPVDILRGLAGKDVMQGSFNVPGIGEQKTFQAEAVNKFNELAQGGGSDVGAGLSMAGELVKTPLAGIETAAAYTGLTKGLPKLLDKRGVSKALARLKNTPETLTRAEEKAAALEGRVKTTMGGRKDILPSKTEVRAAELLSGKTSGNVTKNPKIIKDEIARRGQEVESFLAKNSKPVSAQEQATLFATKRKGMEKVLDKSQLKAFDEQWKMFTKQLPGRGGYNTGNFYKALKDYEDNVASNLARGKIALLDPTGVASAKIQGAKTVREIVRTMIGEKHPEFKGKMFDLASLYDVLDTAVTKSRQLSGSSLSRFIESHPIGVKVTKGAALTGLGYGATKMLQKPNPMSVNSNE